MKIPIIKILKVVGVLILLAAIVLLLLIRFGDGTIGGGALFKLDDRGYREMIGSGNGKDGHSKPAYNDTIIAHVVDTEMDRAFPEDIDTLAEFQALGQGPFLEGRLSHVTMENVKALNTTDHTLSPAQSAVLQVTHRLYDHSYSERFAAYLCYRRSDESHYGNAIELVCIPSKSTAFSRLVLAQHYGNENYQRTMASRFVSRDTIIRTVIERFGPEQANDRGDPDEQVFSETYAISVDGQIQRIYTKKMRTSMR